MAYCLDFHFHSSFSDGHGLPRDIVAAALAKDPRVRHLALSDHNSFQGSRPFLTACQATGIEGFVSCELSGSHPACKDREFHFLINFGPEWNDDVAARTRKFAPYFKMLHRVEAENAILFFDLLKAQGESQDTVTAGYDILRTTETDYESDDPPAEGVSLFKSIRRMIAEKKIPEKYGVRTPLELEKKLWNSAGRFPAPTPVINEAFDIIRETRPRVTLAHPHKYNLDPAALKPLLIEWMGTIGLFALELHYEGRLVSEYRPLADELGLLISVGSDSHNLWKTPGRETSSGGLPVLDDELTENAEILLDMLRRRPAG